MDDFNFEGFAIAVSLPRESEFGLQKGGKLTAALDPGYLVLDKEKRVIAFGDPGKLKAAALMVEKLSGKEPSLKLGQGDWRFTFGLATPKVSDNGAMLLKKHCLVFDLGRSGFETKWGTRTKLVFWGGLGDLEAFSAKVAALRKQWESEVQKEVASEMKVKEFYEVIVTEGIAAGHIALSELADRHRTAIRAFAKERVMPCETSAEEVALLEEGFRLMIRERKLTGVLDGHTYVDRDFVVKQQRVVNVSMDLDFNALVKQLGDKGIALNTIQCPQCRTNCSLPPSGSAFNCEACGAQIRVTDMVEKFKGLLMG